ncbi:MAG: glycosyltransferase [Dysgonamonadaceae bacterium]|jgi:glycosyltransferase involved in cell wall biosynthesis|nr:glycosyltransferase [Dysgonamonadaceae bacterium]
MKNDKVIVSVVLPVYNGEKYLREAIDSILNQTFRAFELIVIDNASTDSTREIVRSYTDPRLVLVENETNRGLIYSLNRGLSVSRGKYIARIDADDISLPGKLQRQYDYMEAHPETGICGNSMESFNETTHYRQRIDFAVSDREIRAFAFFQSPFNHPSVLLRKAVLDQHQLQYPELYYNAEDYGLWIEMLKHTQGHNIPAVLTRYRKHEGSETARDDKKIENKIKIVLQLHTRYLNQNGIFLDPDQMQLYTRFTDRSFPCELNGKNQRALKRVLESFLLQLHEKQAAIYPAVVHYLSVNTFYKFFINRKFPRSFFLLKLFLRGSLFYLNRRTRSVFYNFGRYAAANPQG